MNLHRWLRAAGGKPRPTRRAFLSSAIAASAATVGRAQGAPSVAIVGAGLAGLACAYELLKSGIRATIYEGNTRTGGRCFSLRNFFPGQVAERGGEFIDTLGKTMLGYAQEFGLTLEDVNKEPGDTFYFYNGQRVAERAIIEELRAFVPAMRNDLASLSAVVNALNPTPADIALDRISLAEYLVTRKASTTVRKAVESSYVGEYGRDPGEQSCLNFLLYIRADRRSKFEPYGVSDQRYHIVEGNDAVTAALASRLPGQIVTGRALTRIAQTAGGHYTLSFAKGGAATHDVVVLAIPFTTLRDCELQVPLSPAKLNAIQKLGYGNDTKMMVGFDSRPWQKSGGNGVVYADTSFIQNTWETNPANATASRAVITNYSGGQFALTLNTPDTPGFLSDYDKVFPGALAAATRVNGKYRVHVERWHLNPWSKGSYTCYFPGQFTSIAGFEGTTEGNIYFAGEHADSFYNWQGFMEGAAVSGVTAAKEIGKKFGKL
jgi:monoamine oxidase